MNKQTTVVAEPETRKKAGINLSPYQKLVVALLAILQFSIVIDFMILSPLGDILMKDIHLDPDQFSEVVAAYGISAGITGFLTAGFADKFDRKKLLLFFYIGFIIGTLFCALANSYTSLFVARIVTGVFGGVVGSIVMAIITDLFSIQQRGRVMGFVQMAFAGSQILGIPVGLHLATTYNWHVTFYMVVGLSLAALALVIWGLKPVNAHLKLQKQGNAIVHLWNTVRKREYRIGFFATAMLSMGGFMIMPFSSAFLVNNIGIKQDDLKLIFLCSGLSSIIVMPLIGRLADKIDKFTLFTGGSILAMIMVLIYTNLTPVSIGIVIVINMVMFMGIMGRVVPATALNSAVPFAADRGAYMSINASLQYMAGGIAARVAGLIVKQKDEHSPLENFNVLGIILTGVIIFCIYLMYRVSKLVKARLHVKEV